MVGSSEQIAIGCDHAGFEVKEYIRRHLEKAGYAVQDFGAFSAASVDYPDIAHPLAKAVEEGVYKTGILICGSGNGVAITANKYTGIRAAICWKREITLLARQHNDANIIVLPARFVSHEEALDNVMVFLATGFEGGRHARRVEKINDKL